MEPMGIHYHYGIGPKTPSLLWLRGPSSLMLVYMDRYIQFLQGQKPFPKGLSPTLAWLTIGAVIAGKLEEGTAEWPEGEEIVNPECGDKGQGLPCF